MLGAAERYGFDKSLFHDCRRDLDGAVASIARAINASSADNPLYFILAGPMEVPYLGIQKSDPAKRKFVYCISHSSWNDGYSTRYKYHAHQAQRDRAGRALGADSRPEPPEHEPVRPGGAAGGMAALPLDARFAGRARALALGAAARLHAPRLFRRRHGVVPGDGRRKRRPGQAEARCSTSTSRPPVAAARNQVRLEAENFRHLDGCAVEYRNDRKASQSVQVALTADAGRIRTPLRRTVHREPKARYDVDVRFLDENGSRSRFTLLVNGAAQGAAWESAGQGRRLDDPDRARCADPRSATRSPWKQAAGRPGSTTWSSTPPPRPAPQDPGRLPGLLRVAVVQMALRPTLAENRDRIVAGIAQAAERDARVAVFPERALTGSGSERQDLVDEAVDAIRDAVQAQRINVVFGAHTWLPSIKTNGNWMLALGPDGRDLLRYEKLYNNHRATMPGVFAVDGVPCGTAICADRWLRGVVEIPIQQGAQVHFELSNNYACEWVAPYGWYWNAPLAVRNTVWSVVANSANQVSGVAASRATI